MLPLENKEVGKMTRGDWITISIGFFLLFTLVFISDKFFRGKSTSESLTSALLISLGGVVGSIIYRVFFR